MQGKSLSRTAFLLYDAFYVLFSSDNSFAEHVAINFSANIWQGAELRKSLKKHDLA